jgi:tRNA/tmRNA/rRNA uracil-C5-methylase (TrmA/RlmC/RlmD family)
LSYDTQIATKEKILRETFHHQFEIGETIRSPQIFNYRNKMEYGFTRNQAGQITLGLHPRGRFRHVLDLQECHLIGSTPWQAVEAVKTILRGIDKGWLMGQEGFWQHFTLRHSISRDQLLVTFEVQNPADPLILEVATALQAACPAIVGVFVKERHKLPTLLLGQEYLEEVIDNTLFTYRAENFFQVNVHILPQILAAIKPLIEEIKPEMFYDLFSGVGFFGVALGKYLNSTTRVIAAESDRKAAEIAHQNAKQNQLGNYDSLCIDLYGKNWAALLPQDPGRSVALIDPPRAGLTNNTIAEIIKLSPTRLIYVSCNPTTQKRDIDWLVNTGYKLRGLRLMDMFPQTYHLESLAWLDKN